MFWRLTSFLLLQLAGGIFGAWFWTETGAVLGLLLGGLAWVLADLARGLRVLRWLRQADSSAVPVVAGLWGEVADRSRRALRLREALGGAGTMVETVRGAGYRLTGQPAASERAAA